MFSKKALLVGAMALTLAACEGGDVNINANDNSVNTDNSVTNPGGDGDSADCGQILDDEGNVVAEGTFDGIDCTYPSDFGSPSTPITADITFPAGVHRLGIERMFIIGPRRDHFGEEADRAQERFANTVIPALRAAS